MKEKLDKICRVVYVKNNWRILIGTSRQIEKLILRTKADPFRTPRKVNQLNSENSRWIMNGLFTFLICVYLFLHPVHVFSLTHHVNLARVKFHS